MSKRFGAQIIGQVLEMKEQGYTHRQIGDALGYSAMQIKRLVGRHYHSQRGNQAAPNPIGRPRKRPSTREAENHRRIKELEAELALYKAFFCAVIRIWGQ